MLEFINRNLYGRSHYFVRITTCNLKYDNFLTECFSHFQSPLKKGRTNIIKKIIIHKMSCLNTKNHWRLNFFIHTILLNTISSKSNNKFNYWYDNNSSDLLTKREQRNPAVLILVLKSRTRYCRVYLHQTVDNYKTETQSVLNFDA